MLHEALKPLNCYGEISCRGGLSVARDLTYCIIAPVFGLRICKRNDRRKVGSTFLRKEACLTLFVELITMPPWHGTVAELRSYLRATNKCS